MTECLTERQIVRRQYRDARSNLRHVCRELDIDPRHFRNFDPRAATPILAAVLHHDLMRYKTMTPDTTPYVWED